MITIPILANFLSIDEKEIKEIVVADQDKQQTIIIIPNPKECICPNPECGCDKHFFKGYRDRKIKPVEGRLLIEI